MVLDIYCRHLWMNGCRRIIWRFIVEVVENLSTAHLERAYAGRGSAAYHPNMLLALLVYGYATGVFSNRKIERATYDSLAFRFIAANQHPDHDTLATFRRRFLDEFAELFVQALLVAREMQMLKLGCVSLDGSKVHANASRHSALSCGHIDTLEAQLRQEVQQLLIQAEQADQSAVPDGMDLPEEITRREEKARTSGKKPGGKPPALPASGPANKDQINLTDEESRIMPVSGGGFEQAYNAQAAVDTDSMLVIAPAVTQACND